MDLETQQFKSYNVRCISGHATAFAVIVELETEVRTAATNCGGLGLCGATRSVVMCMCGEVWRCVGVWMWSVDLRKGETICAYDGLLWQ